MPTRTVVFCDVDGVLRGKGAEVSPETHKEIMSFHCKGGIFNMITGAPLAHVPNIPAHLIFAEAGGVVVVIPERAGVRIFEPGRQAIFKLRQHIGIYEEDGIVETPHGSLIVEGPRRHTSLTFLFGRPPHYPECVTSAKIEEVKAHVDELVRGLPLVLSVEHDTSYSYLDIFSMTKRRAVRTAMEQVGWDKVYVAGDRHPDLEAMLLPGVIPVGFSNSIKEIRALAGERGVYIDFPGPEGGVAEFFRQLNSGKL